MYEDDPFRSILSNLRRNGNIQFSKKNYKMILQDSRSGLSYDECNTYVFPLIAKSLDVKPEQVRLPKAIEYNILGNMFHPEWGKTDSWELFLDKYSNNTYSVGGCSLFGGLTHMFGWVAMKDQNYTVGFRPLIVFP